MRSTITIDDEVFEKASRLIGLSKLSELTDRAFKELICTELLRDGGINHL